MHSLKSLIQCLTISFLFASCMANPCQYFHINGYYVNGHKISCLRCHTATGSHIDGLAQTYRAGLDNYQAGYRLSDVENVRNYCDSDFDGQKFSHS